MLLAAGPSLAAAAATDTLVAHAAVGRVLQERDVAAGGQAGGRAGKKEED